jgi:ATP-binding cassette subfamily F protein 3
LEEYEGTILLVSHDRAMLEALTSRVWVLHDTHITDFPGSFTEWEEQSREREHAASVTAAEQESLRRIKEKKSTRRRESEGGDNRAEIRELRRRVEEAEKQVNELESKIIGLTKLLEDPELYTTREGTEKALVAGKQLDDTRRLLDTAIEKWTAATEKAETLSAS